MAIQMMAMVGMLALGGAAQPEGSSGAAIVFTSAEPVMVRVRQLLADGKLAEAEETLKAEQASGDEGRKRAAEDGHRDHSSSETRVQHGLARANREAAPVDSGCDRGRRPEMARRRPGALSYPGWTIALLLPRAVAISSVFARRPSVAGRNMLRPRRPPVLTRRLWPTRRWLNTSAR